MSRQRNRAAPLDALDRVEVVDGTEVHAEKIIRADDPYLSGHYPEFPIYPGVFTLETVCQAVRAVVADARLREVSSLRLLAPLVPGDRLHATVSCQDRAAGELVARACCTSNGIPVARLTLVFTTVPAGATDDQAGTGGSLDLGHPRVAPATPPDPVGRPGDALRAG